MIETLICVRALGGRLAASASATYPHGDTRPGTWITIAGIIVEFVSITIFGFFCVLLFGVLMPKW